MMAAHQYFIETILLPKFSKLCFTQKSFQNTQLLPAGIRLLKDDARPASGTRRPVDEIGLRVDTSPPCDGRRPPPCRETVQGSDPGKGEMMRFPKTATTRRPLALSVGLLLPVIATGMAAAPARAAVAYTWVGGHGSTWTDERNWSPLGVPGDGDSVTVTE